MANIENQITYLFGAGASHPTCPLISTMHKSIVETKEKIFKELDNFCQEIKSIEIPGLGAGETAPLRDAFCKDYEWLESIAKNNSTIDVYAKKLYDNRSKDYNRFKKIYSLYFNYLQFDKPVDNKYNSFISHLAKRDAERKLPDGINILTWNYDFQLEKAFGLYFDREYFHDAYTSLNLFHPKRLPSADKFSFFRINGSCGFIDQFDMTSFIHPKFEIQSGNIIQDLIEHYIRLDRNKINSNLNFAWEEDSCKDLIKCLPNVLHKTEILVSVGYSFPYFNRDTDRKIFNAMNGPSQIFIQGIDPFVNSDVENFRHISKNNVSVVSNLNSFYLPTEL